MLNDENVIKIYKDLYDLPEFVHKEMVDFNSRPENYNLNLNYQRNWMDTNMGWLESKEWINNFLKIFE